jgi:hypothetical protein
MVIFKKMHVYMFLSFPFPTDYSATFAAKFNTNEKISNFFNAHRAVSRFLLLRTGP